MIGVGGLGHMATRLLRTLTPARVVAIVGSRPEGDVTALRLGAQAAFRFEEVDVTEVQAELGSAGAALVLDFVGSDDTANLAAQLVAMGGHMVMLGLCGEAHSRCPSALCPSSARPACPAGEASRNSER